MHTDRKLENFPLNEVFTQMKTLKRATVTSSFFFFTVTSNLRCETHATLYGVEYFIRRIIFLECDEFHVCRGNDQVDTC